MEKPKYAIRKLSVGVGSVMIGLTIGLNSNVLADVSVQESKDASSITTKNGLINAKPVEKTVTSEVQSQTSTRRQVTNQVKSEDSSLAVSTDKSQSTSQVTSKISTEAEQSKTISEEKKATSSESKSQAVSEVGSQTISEEKKATSSESKSQAVSEVGSQTTLITTSQSASGRTNKVNASNKVGLKAATRAEDDSTQMKMFKESAKSSVDTNKNLTAEQKEEYKKKIDEAKSEEDVTSIVDESTAFSEQQFKDKIIELQEYVRNSKKLTEKNKDVGDKLAAGSLDLESLNLADRWVKAQEIEDIQNAKDAAKKTIDTLNNLTVKQKQDFKNQVDGSTTIPQIDKIVTDAQNLKNETDLKEKKNQAKKDIDALGNLTTKEKEDFKNQVDGATTTDSIDKVVDEAKKQDAKNKADKDLKDKKDQGKKEIDGMGNLTDKEKEDAKRQIDGTTTTDGVDKIIDETKKQAEKNLQDKKDGAKKEIDGMGNLTDKEKEDAKKQIDGATTTDGIDKIIDGIKTGDKDLQDKKDGAKKEIDGMGNLTDKEKEDAKKQIDGATTTDGVDKIIDETKKQAEKNLQDKKDGAKKEIDGMGNLTDKEKEDAKKQIEGATTTDGIDKIIDEAKKQAEKNKNNKGDKSLQEKKDAAK
ncbi:YSIRK-type signal peptide-containing protein, partial [Weissella uvarum]